MARIVEVNVGTVVAGRRENEDRLEVIGEVDMRGFEGGTNEGVRVPRSGRPQFSSLRNGAGGVDLRRGRMKNNPQTCKV